MLSVKWRGSLAALGVVMTLTGCTDKAQPEFGKCLAAEAKRDLFGAATACGAAVAADPNSNSGRAAAMKLSDLQPAIAKIKAEKAAAEAKAAAEKAATDAAAREAAALADKARWRTMPATLEKKLRAQVMGDVGRGTDTPAMDVITMEIGQPIASYEAFGSTVYVWGARPSSTKMDDVKATPFSIRIKRGLTCGDYAPNMVEFYSYGERLWP